MLDVVQSSKHRVFLAKEGLFFGLEIEFEMKLCEAEEGRRQTRQSIKISSNAVEQHQHNVKGVSVRDKCRAGRKNAGARTAPRRRPFELRISDRTSWTPFPPANTELWSYESRKRARRFLS